MIRVLMVCKACVVGIYQRKLELIAGQGIHLRVIVPPSWRDERGEQPLERVYTSGYELQPSPIIFNGNFHLHFFPQLGKHIRSFQPHILHIDEEPYNIAAWHSLYQARRIGAKSLFFCWQNIKRVYPPPFAWGERWSLNNVDYLLVGTDSAGDIWREKGYTGAMATIPQFGTDPDLFQPTDPESRPYTIGYIGRLVEEKGIHHLLYAAAKLSGEWRLRIVGGGPYQSTLQGLAHQLGITDRVDFIGQIPSTDMPEQYQLLDVLVLPSLTRPNWKEQFGRVLVEAMASGVAVIGSSSGAIPSVVGDGGLIFPEGNIDALRAHLIHLQHDRIFRQQLGEKGRARVLDHFTHERVAQATVDIYRRLVG